MDIADGHNDLLMGVLYERERGVDDPFGDFWLPQLRAGGVVLQILPIYTEEQFAAEGALRRALLHVECARELAARHASDVAIVETSAELDAALAAGRIAFVLGLEGLEPVGPDLVILETFSRLGVRTASLSWNRRTQCADGVGEHDTGGRLTRLGVAAVEAMEQLGVAVDVSHLSAAGLEHVTEVAARPFFASHSSCRALCDHPRNLDDRQLQLVAASGGCVGINAFSGFLAAGSFGATIDGFVDHVVHACGVIGDDHVALGTDFIEDLMSTMNVVVGNALIDGWPETTKHLARPADLAILGDRLVERLGEEPAGRVGHQNLVSYFRRHLPAPPPGRAT